MPLELGDVPNDPRNLWPEPGASPNPKDAVEDELSQEVCGGRLAPALAQRAIATNWVAVGDQITVRVGAAICSTTLSRRKAG